MPFHEHYADGTPRPLFRGWLHGIAACIALPLAWAHWTSLPAPAIPGILALCATLVLSSLVHLVQWPSASLLEIMTRLDKTGILAICGCSFWGPQLLESSMCKPTFLVSLSTVAIPVALSVLGVACGMGPIVFGGCGIAIASTLWFYGTQVQDNAFFFNSLACASLYGSGLLLYVIQAGGHRRYWGYHEWMHVLITVGFVVNARGLLLMSQYTEEACVGTEDQDEYWFATE